MRHKGLSLLVLSLAAASLMGCDYDPETRLFRQVAPKPADVVLAPPGAKTEGSGPAPSSVRQALETCAEDSLRCHAQNIATGLNTVTFSLLTIVDEVVKLPPTRREVGRRVWGPHFAFEQGGTFRFEMAREDDGTFSWCLHAGRGDLTRAPDVDALGCENAEHESGMLLVLSGVLTPGAEPGEAARSGSGSMVLEGPHLRELDASLESLGLITVVYDNTRGRELSIEVEEADEPSGLFGTGVTYEYTSEPDGSGTFYFAARANFVGGGGSFGFDPVLEDLVIRSRWTAEGAGRADGTVSGGDLEEGERYEAIQCWDSGLTTTYLENTYEGTTSGVMETDCVFQEPLPSPAEG